MSRASRFAKPFRVTDGRSFRLKDIDPRSTGALTSRQDANGWREWDIARLTELQEKLYAQDRWGLLLIFQAMDAAGKDGTIKHVMSGVNPQGCQVYSFKAPSAEELDHDFLWRTTRCLPERGRIGIFNRSYYEEVLVVRVHPELLGYQKLPKGLVTKQIWQTSSVHAPWYVVPADNKWFTRLVVGAAVIEAMEEMSLAFPKMDRAQRQALAAARAELDGRAGRARSHV
jgi:polyphosphate kinase 2 (PPK2 family)